MKNIFSKLGSLASAPARVLASKATDTIIKKYSLSLARLAVSSLATLLLAHGFTVSGSQEEQLVGAVAALIVVFASRINVEANHSAQP